MQKEIESREWTQVILPPLVRQARIMSITLSKRLDSLNELIVSIKIVLDQIEKHIQTAEQKSGLYPSPSSFRSVFKYFVSFLAAKITILKFYEEVYLDDFGIFENVNRISVKITTVIIVFLMPFN